MYFLVIDVCDKLSPIFGIVNFIINAIMIGIPILLIILGMVDLGKAVISSKEDEVKKATKSFGKRFLFAVAVFAVSWLVPTVLDLVASATNNQIDPNQSNWSTCWTEIRKS